MLFYRENRLDAMEGRHPKGTRIQWIYLISGLIYHLLLLIGFDYILDAQIKNIVFWIATVMIMIPMIVSGLQNRKREDAEFAWNSWIIMTILVFIRILSYLSL